MDPTPAESRAQRAARPYFVRGAAAGIVALAGMVVGSFGDVRAEGDTGEVVLGSVGAGLLLIGGFVAVRSVARGVRTAIDLRAGPGKSAAPNFFILALGYAIVAFLTLRALGVDISGLAVGGALTGVLVAIAAQQSLGNFFAGVMLLIVRPFSTGDRVVMKSGPLGGEYEGLVTDMGLFYVSMETDRGPVALPNAGVLTAAIGPGVRSADEVPEEDGPSS